MSRKHSKNTERQLIDIVNSRANLNKCGECGADYPTWASWNLGILLCGRCASIHKKVLSVRGPRGGPISKVKSLTLETWSDDQIETLRRIGNKKAKQRWNPKRVPFPHSDDDEGPIEQYFRDKYIYGRFRNDPVDGDDNFLHYSDDYTDSRALTPASGNRSRLLTLNRRQPQQIPRLLHRKLTTFEQGQYQAQVHKIMSYGYSDRDAVAESVLLAQGDVDFALDILDHDSRVNPSLAELPPDLPKRPLMSTAASAPSIPATSSSPEWWTGTHSVSSSTIPTVGATVTGATANAAGGPQIYQYTDPITGQVSYVDLTGQQYLDPSNPQHQQLLMQQTNPQLVAQQTNKLNIMALYGQPNNFTTNAAAPQNQNQQTFQNTQGQVQQNQMQNQMPQNQLQGQMQGQLPGQMQQMQQPSLQYAPTGVLQVYMQPTVQQQTGMYGQVQYGQQQYWR